VKIGGRHLSIEEKGIIVGMNHSEMSQYSIATKLGIPHSIFEYVLKRFQNYRTVVTCKAIRRCCKVTK